MKINNKACLALLKLREPIYCACGEKLIIEEVVDIKKPFLLLGAYEESRPRSPCSSACVIYNFETNKCLKPGTFPKREKLEYWPPKELNK